MGYMDRFSEDLRKNFGAWVSAQISFPYIGPDLHARGL